MPNPNPTQSAKFVRKRFNAPDIPEGETLAAKVHGIRLPPNVNDAVEKLGKNKTPWLRQAICDIALQQGLVKSIFDRENSATETRTYGGHLVFNQHSIPVEVEAPKDCPEEELHHLMVVEVIRQLQGSRLQDVTMDNSAN